MKLLARALEAIEAPVPEEQTVVMMGPLSAIYAKALDIAYAKQDPAMESQQMDVAIMQKLAAAMSPNSAPTSNFQTVYGVSRNALTQDVVIDITQELAKNNGEFYLIIDATQPGANGTMSAAPQETFKMIQALESLVASHGGKVFSNLQDFANSR